MSFLIPPVVQKTVTGNYGYSPQEVPDLTGRVALVTGGTNGIGLAMSRALYTRGATLYVLSHSEDTGRQGVAYIKSGKLSDAPGDFQAGFTKETDTGGLPTGIKEGSVEFVQCNLESLKEVAKTAKELKSKLERLDLALLIAGKGVNAFALTEEGIDSHLAMNNLAHHLLLSHLMENLRNTTDKPNSDVRIVSMSSELHRATIDGPTMFGDKFRTEEEFTKDVGPNSLYARTKLCVLLFTKAVYQRYLSPKPSVLIFATHPGAVATGQQDQFKPAFGETIGTIMSKAVRPFMREPDTGMLSALWCATAPELRHGEWENHSGRYFTDPKELGGRSGEAADQELVDNFFNNSEKIIAKIVGPENVGKW